MRLVDLLFGRRLSNDEQDTCKIGWFEAVPAMGLDGLGSASYGSEAALTVLIPLGTASLAWVGWVMAPIVALLVVLYLSYRQRVVAYPTNGGLHEPLLSFITRLDEDTPGRSVAVLIPEAVKRRWWEYVLHTNRAERLRRMLLIHGGPRVNVVIVPWRLGA